jgi:hypothetical protein
MLDIYLRHCQYDTQYRKTSIDVIATSVVTTVYLFVHLEIVTTLKKRRRRIKNSVAVFCKRTLPTEQPPLFGEVSNPYNFKVGYLTTLSVLKLYGVDDTMFNVCLAVGRMRICKGNWNSSREPTPVSVCILQISCELCGIALGPPRWIFLRVLLFLPTQYTKFAEHIPSSMHKWEGNRL